MNNDKTVAEYLNRFSAEIPVSWDRYCESSGEYYDVYGWIKRSDGGRDFVLLQFYFSDDQKEVSFVTSSAKYSEKIYNFMFGEDDGHNSCIKISDLPGISLPVSKDIKNDELRCEHELTVEDYFGLKLPFPNKNLHFNTLVDLVCAAREGYVKNGFTRQDVINAYNSVGRPKDNDPFDAYYTSAEDYMNKEHPNK